MISLNVYKISQENDEVPSWERIFAPEHNPLCTKIFIAIYELSVEQITGAELS